MIDLQQGVLPGPVVEAAGMLSAFLDLITAASSAKGRKDIEGTVAALLKASEGNKALLAEAQAVRLDTEKLAEVTANTERGFASRSADLDTRSKALDGVAARQTETAGAMATKARELKDREARMAATEKEIDGMRVSLAARLNKEAA